MIMRSGFQESAPGNRPSKIGFTLIELLVVIAIIAILAAVLLPAIGTMKRKAQIVDAKAEMARLKTAIAQYQSEYSGRMPVSSAALASCNNNCPDMTFGTVLSNGTVIAASAIISTGNNGYQNCNGELITILTDTAQWPNLGHSLNPRKINLFQAKRVSDTNSPGLGPDGILRDPWSNPYIITVDLNDDDKCQDGFYYPLTKGANTLLVPGSVMIWSMGPDRKADPSRTVGPKGGVNKDNVLSWE
jgi:prepilin-type N-terminal cleavage/methylation domain-containing protein